MLRLSSQYTHARLPEELNLQGTLSLSLFYLAALNFQMATAAWQTASRLPEILLPSTP